MRTKGLAVAAVITLGLAACGTTSGPPEDAVAGASSPGSSVEPGSEKSTARGKASDKTSKGKKKGTGPGAPGDGGGGSSSGNGSGSQGSGGSSGSGSADIPPPGGTKPGDGGGGSKASALYPTSGTYVYAQSGYEEFCTTTCDRQKLPNRQAVTSRLTGRSRGSAVVVTEAQASDSRMMRTTTSYNRKTADITEVYVRFTYSGFTFSQTYRPSPPVASLRFPLTSGDRWQGKWDGQVSGDYKVTVLGRENVSAARRTVQAVKLDTRTNFHGDFEGSANLTVWIDPDTRAILKTAGNLSVSSSFGDYSTGFATALSSGPGY